MNNLVDIVIVVAVVTIVISIWGIYYFIGRIVYTLHRWDGDMPSPEELSEYYAKLNEQNGGDQHPR